MLIEPSLTYFSAILDLHVSRTSNKMAVMTRRDVIILTVVKSEEERRFVLGHAAESRAVRTRLTAVAVMACCGLCRVRKSAGSQSVWCECVATYSGRLAAATAAKLLS